MERRYGRLPVGYGNVPEPEDMTDEQLHEYAHRTLGDFHRVGGEHRLSEQGALLALGFAVDRELRRRAAEGRLQKPVQTPPQSEERAESSTEVQS